MVIDLSGPKGNAYYVLAIAQQLCSETGKDFDAVRARMTASDYSNLIRVFEEEFGDRVKLKNKPK